MINSCLRSSKHLCHFSRSDRNTNHHTKIRLATGSVGLPRLCGFFHYSNHHFFCRSSGSVLLIACFPRQLAEISDRLLWSSLWSLRRIIRKTREKQAKREEEDLASACQQPVDSLNCSNKRVRQPVINSVVLLAPSSACHWTNTEGLLLVISTTVCSIFRICLFLPAAC